MAIQEALKILAEFDDQASPQIKALNAQLEEINKGVESAGNSSVESGRKVGELAKGTSNASAGVGNLGRTAESTSKKVGELGNRADQANRTGLVGLRSLIRNISFDFLNFASGGNAAGDALGGLSSSALSSVGEVATAVTDTIEEVEHQAAAVNRVASSLDLLGSAARIAGTGLVAVIAVVESLGFSVRQAADDTAELADKLGITVDRLETLTLLANENGGSVQGLVSVYDRLSKSLNKLDDDNKKAEESFAALGIQQKDLANLSETEIAGKLVANYELLNRSTEATAAIQQLLGGSFRDQIPAIKEAAANFGSYEERVRTYGSTTTPELIAAGGRQELALSNLSLAFKGLGIQIAGFASESTAEIAQFTADVIKAFKDTEVAGKVVQVIYQTLAILFVNVSFVLKAVGREIGAIGAQLAAIAKLDFQGFSAISDAVTEDAKLARAELDALEQRILNPQVKTGSPADVRAADNAIAAKEAESAAVRAAAASAKAASERRKAAEEQQKLFAAAKEELESQIRLTGDLNNSERVLAETIDGKYSKFSAQEKQELINLAQKLDAKQKQLELEKQLKEIQDDLNTQAADLDMAELEVSLAGKSVELREKELDLAKELAAVRKASAGLSNEQQQDLETYVRTLNERRASLRLLQKEADVINQLVDGSEAAINASIQNNIQIAKQLFESGKISVLDYTNFVQDQMKRVKKANEEAATESSIFWQEAARGIQGAMSTFFFDFMQGRLGNLAASFKKVIDQMVAQALAAKLADALFGPAFASGKGGNNLGGFVGQAAGFLGGIFGRENGGPVRAGQPYIVGEKRPELFVPNRSGTIVPSLDGLQNAGTNVTFQISAMDSQDVVRSIDQVSRQVAEIVNGASGRYNLRGAR